MSAYSREQVPVAIQDDNAELRTVEGGEMTIAFMTLKKGANFAPALVGLPDDLCPCPHWGYMLKGRVKMTTKDGAEVYEAGEAFYWPPGHAPEALEDSEYIDVSPTAEFNEVISHIKGEG